MLASLTLLRVLQLAGEVLVQTPGLPLPVPVLGLLLLFLALLAGSATVAASAMGLAMGLDGLRTALLLPLALQFAGTR